MKACLKKKLRKVTSYFKSSVIYKGPCRVCSDWWTDLSNKICCFSKHKDYLTAKVGEKEMEMK